MPAPKSRLPAYFGCSTAPPRRHAHLGLWVEQRQVDCGLEAGDRGFVFGVEETRIADRQNRRFARALQVYAREIELARAIELGEARARVGARQQHRVA
jgi:hypothetical protein